MSSIAARQAQYHGTSHFDALDGIRAFAILAVIGHHVGGGHREQILDRGLGVTLFFCLSGYVITALLLRERRKAGAISLHSFYVRRTLRIFPLYYAVLGLYVLLVSVVERGTAAGARFFRDLPYYLSFTSNWFVRSEGQHTIFYFAWSLAAQEQFYLLWPLLLRFTRRWWIPPAVMALLLATGEGARWAIVAGHLPPLSLAARLLGTIPIPICLGSIAAYALEHPRTFAWADAIAGRAWSMPVWLAALLTLSLVDVGPWQVPATSVALVLLVVGCVIRPDHLLRPLLTHPVPRFVGTVSFGIYLLHMLALNVARRLVPGQGFAALFLLTAGMSTAAAWASYSCFERPILEAGKRRLLGRPLPAAPRLASVERPAPAQGGDPAR